MAISITPNMADLNLCDVDNWSGGDLLTPGEIQGNGCMGDAVSATLGTLRTASITSTDMSGGGHVYVWMNCGGQVETQANGGFRVHLQSSSGNNATWFVGGSDTWSGGWQCFVVDPTSSPDESNGTFNPAAVTLIGVRFYTTTTTRVVGREVIHNVFWDAFRFGTGLTITSGASDGITWSDIYDQDNNKTYKWGVVQRIGGVYFVQGSLTFGDSSGTGSIDFDDSGETVVFLTSQYMDVGFNEINVVGNSTGTTNFVMGDLVGGQGISGCTIKSNGTSKVSFTATDTDVDVLKLYGCTFDTAADIQLLSATANREVITCNFIGCGEVIADTCQVQYCNFVNASNDALVIDDNTAFDVTDCTFINCPDAIELITDTDDPWVFDNLVFYNCTYDVLNSTGSSTTITNVNGSNASTYEGTTVTFQSAYTITITVQDSDTNPIENVQTAVYRLSDRTELMNEDTTALGVATEAYTGSIPVDVEVRCRKASGGTTKYVNFSTLGTINGDFNLLVTLKEDPNNNATS